MNTICKMKRLLIIDFIGLFDIHKHQRNGNEMFS